MSGAFLPPHWFDSRPVELFLALGAVAWGAVVAVPSWDHMASPAFLVLLSWLPEWAWGALASALGTVSVAAIIINGRLRPSPLIRSAAAGALFVGATALWVGIALQPGESTGVITYQIISLAWLLCAHRAAIQYEVPRAGS